MLVETIVRWAMIASLAAAATLGVTLPLALRRGLIARARAWRVIRLVLGLLLTVAVAEVVFVIVVKGIGHRGDHQEWREDSPDR